MTDDDGVAILNEIAANPDLPPFMRIEAQAAADACSEQGIHSCREVIALLIGLLSQTDDDRPEKLS